jgi:hypothetical protein
MRAVLAASLLLGVFHASLAAQQGLEAHCDAPEVHHLGAYEACVAAAQAVVSAQPALGILIAGGNPTIGTAGPAGLRLGIVPRISAGARVNVVAVRLPDILAEQIPGQAGAITRRFGVPAPALGGDVSLTLTDGFDLAPGIGGLGAVSLLGGATYLPFSLLGVEGFEREHLAVGIGGRVHVLRESFVAPGVSLSVMHRWMGTVAFGDVCPAGAVPISTTAVNGAQRETGTCPGPGNPGEFSFDLTGWSGRLVASKRFLGLGFTAGLGHDRFGSDLDFGFRGDDPLPGASAAPVVRVTDERLDSSRWSVLANLSYTLLVGTIGLEAGWQQGNPPIRGFRDLQGDFDPRGGTWFGSLGARISL